jgi:HPt (histidine-containing phosphotransfer) domain-containing protein
MSEGFDFPSRDQLELVRGYVAQMAGKRESIQSLWSRVQARPDDQAALRELHLNVHRLAGSAGPYGLPALGEAAQALDRVLALLTRTAEPGKGGSRPDLTSCALLVAALVQALNEAV